MCKHFSLQAEACALHTGHDSFEGLCSWLRRLVTRRSCRGAARCVFVPMSTGNASRSPISNARRLATWLQTGCVACARWLSSDTLRSVKRDRLVINGCISPCHEALRETPRLLCRNKRYRRDAGTAPSFAQRCKSCCKWGRQSVVCNEDQSFSPSLSITC